MNEYKIIFHYMDKPYITHSWNTEAESEEDAIQRFRGWNTCGIINKVKCTWREEKKTMELKGKVSVELTEDDIKGIITEYFNGCENFIGNVTKDNIEFMYETVENRSQMYPKTKTVLKKCRIRM